MTCDRKFCAKIRIETGSSINPRILIGLATKGKQMRLLVKTDMVLKTLWFIHGDSIQLHQISDMFSTA